MLSSNDFKPLSLHGSGFKNRSTLLSHLDNWSQAKLCKKLEAGETANLALPVIQDLPLKLIQ